MPHALKKKKLLGECIPMLPVFEELDGCFAKFQNSNFRALSSRKRFVRINKSLLHPIQNYKTPCFLLRAVLEFIERVNDEKLLDETYSLDLFEFWLNHFSGLSFHESMEVRGKIVGRYIPRDEYQSAFPIGMGKVYQGSHFVAAHQSPDVDSTVSSFWGWADAFGCRVAEGTHQWNLPQGLSDAHIRLFFEGLFGKGVLERASRPLPTMTINAADLLTKRSFHRVLETVRGDSIEHSRAEHAVVVVDKEGMYRGEWRSGDAEQVRQVVSGLSHALRWFEGQCHAAMIRVLASDRATEKEVVASYEHVLKTPIQSCLPMKEISEKGKHLLHEYFKKVIGLPHGSHHSFNDLLVRLDELFGSCFNQFLARCKDLSDPELFTKQGLLRPDRVQVVRAIEKVVESMERALEKVREKIEKLSHLLEIKRTVLEYPPTFVTLKSDVDEMRSKIGHFDHLTIVVPEPANQWYPVGVVYADDLRKSILGTVSFRDFSSPEETKMASYIEVISIVDHHKMQIQTNSAPTVVTGDVQSSNTLVAEQSLAMNARYLSAKKPFFVDQNRELCEYFCYLFGILDDTDLLSKVSRRDVFAMKHVLDRMRSIVDKTPSTAVSFDKIAEDKDFVRNAAKALLQNEDLYSIYANVYQFRERVIEEALSSAVEGKPSMLFMDTKEQNGCCRVGQIKLFHSNIKSYEGHRDSLVALWQRESEAVLTARPHIDLFIQMVNTVTSEKEVYRGEESAWNHRDEMWIWIPDGGVPEQHLIGFLNGFGTSSTVRSLTIDVEIIGPRADARRTVFLQNFSMARHIKVNSTTYGPTVMFLRYSAGAINSRKSLVSPYLPKLIP